MKDYLENKDSVFEGLRWYQVWELFEVLKHSTLLTKEHIEKIYTEHAPNFDITMVFLSEIDVIKYKNGQLYIGPIISQDLEQITEKNLVPYVIDRVIYTENRYNSEMCTYLKKYEITNGEITYRPAADQHSYESSVRNFLMELGVVSYDKSSDEYRLAPEFINLYLYASNNTKLVSPKCFLNRYHDMGDIGFEAENAVLMYERKRVGSPFAHLINHIATQNVAAGYDIKSITILERNKVIPRYIEVKAVSARTFQFHWTANEVQVARSLGPWYYLYLLPVGQNQQFIFEQLKVISNPYLTVLYSRGEWIIEEDVIRCTFNPNQRGVM